MTSATHLAEGDVLNTHADFDALPVGTTICEINNDGRQWVKGADGMWDGGGTNSGGPYQPGDFSMGYNRVHRIPTDAVAPPQDNLMRYMWKYRNVAWNGQIQNGVNRDAVMRALTELGVGEDVFPMGPGIELPYSVAAEFMPSKTVIANSYPIKSERYGLWIKDARRNFSPLIGTHNVTNNVTIVQYPGVTETPEWWTAQAEATDEARINEFKIRAYTIGMRVKREQSWCGTYEHVIAAAGVSQRDIRRIRDGQPRRPGAGVTRAEAKNLPLGSVLLFRDPNNVHRWGVFVRTGDSNNEYGFRRHAGATGGGASLGHIPPSGSTLLTMPVTGTEPLWELEPPATDLLAMLPVGTFYTYGGAHYQVARNGMIASINGTPAVGEVRDTGGYEPRVFNSYPIIIQRFEENA